MLTRYRLAFIFGISALAICLMNIFLFGNEILFMYLVSPPSWFIEVFRNIPIEVKLPIVYITTIIFWFLSGLALDRTRERWQEKGRQ